MSSTSKTIPYVPMSIGSNLMKEQPQIESDCHLDSEACGQPSYYMGVAAQAETHLHEHFGIGKV